MLHLAVSDSRLNLHKQVGDRPWKDIYAVQVNKPPKRSVLAQVCSQITNKVAPGEGSIPSPTGQREEDAPLPKGRARRQTVRMRSSRSCSWLTTEGAFVKGHDPLAVFGNAMTSRIEDSPAINMIVRSRPKPMPPCGGMP